MEQTVLTALLEGLATSSPVVITLVFAWYLAERRSTRNMQGWVISQRQVREVLRDAANMPAETVDDSVS